MSQDLVALVSVAISFLALISSAVAVKLSRDSAKAAIRSATATERQAVAVESGFEKNAAIALMKASQGIDEAAEEACRRHMLSHHALKACENEGVPTSVVRPVARYKAALETDGRLIDGDEKMWDRLYGPLGHLNHLEARLKEDRPITYEESFFGGLTPERDEYCAYACLILDLTDSTTAVREILAERI